MCCAKSFSCLAVVAAKKNQKNSKSNLWRNKDLCTMRQKLFCHSAMTKCSIRTGRSYGFNALKYALLICNFLMIKKFFCKYQTIFLRLREDSAEDQFAYRASRLLAMKRLE